MPSKLYKIYYDKWCFKTGYQLKELFLDIVNHSAYEDVKTDLKCWIDLCRESEIGKFIESSNTIENWLDYIARRIK